MENYYKYMMEAEASVTLRNPIFEAEYMTDELSWPTSLYDSFTARLKQFHLHKDAYSPEAFLRKQALEKEKREFLRE